MSYQSSVLPSGYFNLAETTVCLRFLFILCSFSISCIVLHCHLLFSAVWCFTHFFCSPFTGQQQSVSVHKQIYETRLQIVQLRVFFLLALFECDLFSVQANLSSYLCCTMSFLLGE